MKCLICNATSFHNIVNSKDLKIFSCNVCGLYIVPQSKSKIKNVSKYFKNYDLDKYINYYEKFRKDIYKNNWKQITRWKKGGKSLDFGASFGWFLELAPKKWTSFGVEPSPVAVERCKSKHLKVKLGTENKVSDFHTKFDVITMWNVIEHLSNPVKTLIKLKSNLNKDGIIAIAFPNRYGFYNQTAYFLNRISFGLITKPLYILFQADNPVPHLYHFRISDIEKILNSLGFKILQIDSQKIVDTNGLWHREELDKDRMLKLLAFIGIPTLKVLDVLLDLLRINNDEIVIYAKKIE